MIYGAKICSTSGSGSSDYGSNDYSGSGFTCFEPYTQVSFGPISISSFVQDCNSTEIHCDAGMDSEGCWYGNYCINQVSIQSPLSLLLLFLVEQLNGFFPMRYWGQKCMGCAMIVWGV